MVVNKINENESHKSKSLKMDNLIKSEKSDLTYSKSNLNERKEMLQGNKAYRC